MSSQHQVRLLLLLWLHTAIWSVPALAGERLTYIGVSLDRETRLADKKLQDYLRRRADVSFAPEELEYGRVIERLANWRADEGHYRARMTPYVLVAAEMLGARFETLATYRSTATARRTYHSYFVLNRRHFSAPPTLEEVIRFISEQSQRVRFAYHRQFSTSSFFLPSLVFRANRIYHMPESTESLVAIACDKIGANSSSRLVQLVAEGEADLAAVWDGTKTRFEPGGASARLGEKVYFVQLPTALPNDLLVCSASLDRETRERLWGAIEAMAPDEIGLGDFQTWHTMREATDARLALADLRWSARERLAPVTVDVQAADEDGAPGRDLLEAVRQAVRLSSTELVLYDEDFHEHIDFAWRLQLIHDDAVLLASSIPGTGIDDQVFRLSFRDGHDLTRRVVSLVQDRLHRIRYVWPYSSGAPIVLRETAFSIPTGAPVKVQRISWLDPERNKFRAGPLFDSTVAESGFYRLRLDADDFPAGEGQLDPMSNVSYRVYLLRSSEESLLLRLLTVVLLVLLVLAAISSALGLRRGSATASEQSGKTISTGRS